jgi:sulfatase modifying factor 1
MRAASFVVLFFAFGFVRSGHAAANLRSQNMVLLLGGTYVPFVMQSTGKKGESAKFRSEPVTIDPFFLDRNVVTNRKYLHFVETHSEWRKSKVPSIFADRHYLEDWKSDLKLASSKDLDKPVTRVSWFAAKAFCESLDKTLSTTDQWEYALADAGRNTSQVKDRILAWYSKPNSHNLPRVGTNLPNGFGLSDMVAVVWEWTLDFNSFLAGDELRDSGDKDNGLFCGGGTFGKLDASDYATFMRYSFRTSLKASYTTGNLGFRCAREKQ